MRKKVPMITRVTIPLRKALCLCHKEILGAFCSGKAVIMESTMDGSLMW